jgi:hypothetical protein
LCSGIWYLSEVEVDEQYFDEDDILSFIGEYGEDWVEQAKEEWTEDAQRTSLRFTKEGNFYTAYFEEGYSHDPEYEEGYEMSWAWKDIKKGEIEMKSGSKTRIFTVLELGENILKLGIYFDGYKTKTLTKNKKYY